MSQLDYLQQIISELSDDLDGIVALDEEFTFSHRGEDVRGRVYRRFNDHVVVAFEVAVCTTRFNRAKQTLINQLNGQLPFTTFKIKRALAGQHTVLVTHSLSATSVSVDQLVQTLDSLSYHASHYRETFERNEMPSNHSTSYGVVTRDVTRDVTSDTTNDANDSVDDDVDDLSGVFGDGESARRARTPRVRTEARKTDRILGDLRRLVGLEPVKCEVAKLVAAREFNNARVANGLPMLEQSPHLVFTGNPGTGKTTVARMVAELYKALGVLKKGHVVEADCSKLIAAYIGQTPIKTQRLCEQARGGVLFIDEAYGLTAHQNQGYGPEAIETLLKFMEDNRGDIVVIVAGYPTEMQGFLDANPGLRSRFDVVIDFPDYSPTELVKIFDLYLNDKQLTLTPAARERVEAYVRSLPRSRGFGNGREMRNLFNEVVRRHSVRVVHGGRIASNDLVTIDADDIPVPAPAAMSQPMRVGAYL
jgi:hypothetical protein